MVYNYPYRPYSLSFFRPNIYRFLSNQYSARPIYYSAISASGQRHYKAVTSTVLPKKHHNSFNTSIQKNIIYNDPIHAQSSSIARSPSKPASSSGPKAVKSSDTMQALRLWKFSPRTLFMATVPCATSNVFEGF